MEDHSMNSMTRTTTSHELPEESSWTMYLQDFPLSSNYADDDDDGSSFLSSGPENCSVISDAGSSATRRLSGVNNGQGLRFAIDGTCKQKFVIKRGTRQGLVDDELEDTAISPVSSPKVCHLIQSDKMKPTMQTENTGTSNAGKGSTSGGRAERSQLGFNIGPGSDCTELKKRGLCLVPFSVAANYFG